MTAEDFEELCELKRSLESIKSSGIPSTISGIRATVNLLIQKEADKCAKKLRQFQKLDEEYGGFIDVEWEDKEENHQERFIRKQIEEYSLKHVANQRNWSIRTIEAFRTNILYSARYFLKDADINRIEKFLDHLKELIKERYVRGKVSAEE